MKGYEEYPRDIYYIQTITLNIIYIYIYIYIPIYTFDIFY